MLNWIKNELKQGKTLIPYGTMRAGGFGLSFLIPIILAMKFPPELFGIYSLGMMIVYFFNATFILSSVKPAIVYGTIEIKARQKISKTLTARIILLLLAFMMFLFVVLIFKNAIIQFTKLTNWQVFFLIFIFTGKAIENLIGTIFLTLNRRIIESAFQLVTACISVIYIICLFLYFDMTLENVFLLFLVAPLLSFCFFFPLLDYQKIFPPAFDRDTFKKLFDYTKWMALGGTAVYFLNWGDNLILRQFVSMKEIGVYNLGYQFFKGTVMLMAIVRLYFLPFIAQHIDNKEKIENYLFVKRRKLMVLGAMILSLLFLFMPAVTELLYETQYEDAALVFRILTFGAVCALYFMFYDPIFDSLEKYHVIQIMTVICVIVNLCLDYILVRRIGFIGAAVATSVSYFLLALAIEVYFRKYCKTIVI